MEKMEKMEMDGLAVVDCVGDIPSAAEFASQFEDRNVPVLLVGAVKEWPACELWDPGKGGLQYLKDVAGLEKVQVMATKSGSNFYGDIRGHERVPISFGAFVDLAAKSLTLGRNHVSDLQEDCEGLKGLRNLECSDVNVGVGRTSTEMREPEVSSPVAVGEGSLEFQLYLAQVGIFTQDSKAKPPLEVLMRDVSVPRFLGTTVSNINLWMSVNGSRSSTHYDPYHNLLCVVAGRKQVTLWPPSAAPFLYPMPIYGEASNHSAVDFVQPELGKYPRFEGASRHCRSVTVDAGDALFMPEGWYHQVDSEGVTMAVNLWWVSNLSSKLGTHMDAYLLRRVLVNLVDSEKEKMIDEVSTSAGVASDREWKAGAARPPDKTEGTSVWKVENLVLEQCGDRGKKDLCRNPTAALCNDYKVKARCMNDREGSDAEGSDMSRLQRPGGSPSFPIMERAASGTRTVKTCKKILDGQVSGTVVRSKRKGRRKGKGSNSLKAEDVIRDEDSQVASVGTQSAVVCLNAVHETNCLNSLPLDCSDQCSGSFETTGNQRRMTMETLTASEIEYLRTLVLCVSAVTESTADRSKPLGTAQVMNENSTQDPPGHNPSDVDVSLGAEGKEAVGKEDLIAQIFSSLDPLALHRLLLVMVTDFPRTFEALILNGLSPVASEILTRKFEEIDATISETSQAEFYERIYSVFDDPQLAMAALLDRKEAFASTALNRVMDGFLGLSCGCLRE